MHWCINFTNNELNNQTCRMQIILSAYGQISQMIGHKKKKKIEKMKAIENKHFLKFNLHSCYSDVLSLCV